MAKTVEQWRDRTPKGFIFAAKVPQVVTHQKVLIDTKSDLKAFLGVMDLLGDPRRKRWRGRNGAVAALPGLAPSVSRVNLLGLPSPP
jgi:hypothetical protein